MLQRAAEFTVILLLLSAVLPALTTAGEPNFFEVVIARYESSGSVLLYEIGAGADKEGATTCELVTPSGTYSLFEADGEFRTEQQFIDDHTDMSFAEMTAEIAVDWVLTWDASLSTETVATISFGSIPEEDFLLVPTLTVPVDQAIIVVDPPTMEWTYGATLPCNAQLSDIEASISDQVQPDAGTGQGNDSFACSDTSWTPDSPFGVGTWFFRIANSVSSYRNVPDGISITGDSWTLQNSDWLALQSIDRSENVIQSVSTEERSWGAIKTLYRR
jgi:hypothetical protein